MRPVTASYITTHIAVVSECFHCARKEDAVRISEHTLIDELFRHQQRRFDLSWNADEIDDRGPEAGGAIGVLRVGHQLIEVNVV